MVPSDLRNTSPSCEIRSLLPAACRRAATHTAGQTLHQRRPAPRLCLPTDQPDALHGPALSPRTPQGRPERPAKSDAATRLKTRSLCHPTRRPQPRGLLGLITNNEHGLVHPPRRPHAEGRVRTQGSTVVECPGAGRAEVLTAATAHPRVLVSWPLKGACGEHPAGRHLRPSRQSSCTGLTPAPQEAKLPAATCLLCSWSTQGHPRTPASSRWPTTPTHPAAVHGASSALWLRMRSRHGPGLSHTSTYLPPSCLQDAAAPRPAGPGPGPAPSTPGPCGLHSAPGADECWEGPANSPECLGSPSHPRRQSANRERPQDAPPPGAGPPLQPC